MALLGLSLGEIRRQDTRSMSVYGHRPLSPKSSGSKAPAVAEAIPVSDSKICALRGIPSQW